jgi:hypothetical protein
MVMKMVVDDEENGEEGRCGWWCMVMKMVVDDGAW